MMTVCVFLTAGCAYEKRVARSQPGPPNWVHQVPEDTEGKKVFVGMALADNILDERTARRKAMDDVREQIALSLMTDVKSESMEIVEQEGAQHLGEDEDEGAYHAELQNKARQALAGVRQDAYYWEKWRVKRGLFSGSFVRYKYYIRATMPREHYEEIYRSLAQDILEGG
jgi:hypothetical protein